jgi:hypothetical protein
VQLQQKTAQAQRRTKNLTTRAQQNISPTAAQTKNYKRPKGNSDSATPTKNCARQALNKNKNINHHHHTSSTKNFPHRHSNKKMRKPKAQR